ncbi:hypothetical protein BD309DRAFT_959964 [Dichomitus squalens]|uniref:Uncharacterized protein n=2 Tax=Dichomitus squalens TaxID=114155 RepID=A0A4Q9PIC9_9APHY|nr:uncharacterized protein DICSQDRAFT_105007 [Dichomitus squalens LYAD-421 SS1]EJF61903.1 hypothetical protein DICSQDRAFT_105007 [Dichomitus squalens LYAD-421 SS1]TBU43739.1 hypothetical protein BD309DRAFT_959964 [Dichomitus squalens]TBU53822.1 hypothetical protein BD310DRAFT_937286 [Dichomitus squalens]
MVGLTERDFLAPGEVVGEGDSYVGYDFLPPELAEAAFDNLKKEVKWITMMHRGGEVPRLVAVEGRVLEDGSFPIYRHPADESPPCLPFSPTVERIRQHVEDLLQKPVNHVLIQHYRSGCDYISEHSDKTIDVVRGSQIVNVSLGAQRFMTLRTKKDALANPKADLDAAATESSVSDRPNKRGVQRVPLPHNSILVMGLQTNAKWLHSIRTDKRPLKIKSPAEQLQNGERISLTFRTIGTFLTKDEERIFGQGARGKTREDARPVVRGGPEAEKLIVAFGAENHQSDFDWDANYGEGSDVLHFTTRAS